MEDFGQALNYAEGNQVSRLNYDLGMVKNLRTFLKDESGATAIEYGLIAAGVALAIITAVKGVGTKLNTTFSSISSQLN